MNKAEKKLSILKKGKNKMAPKGNRTSEVNKEISSLNTAFKDYIKSDNINVIDQVNLKLTVSIEEHEDFNTAVYYINCAINKAQEKVDEAKNEVQNEGVILK